MCFAPILLLVKCDVFGAGNQQILLRQVLLVLSSLQQDNLQCWSEVKDHSLLYRPVFLCEILFSEVAYKFSWEENT